MIQKKVFFYDIEQFPNFHSCHFKDRDSDYEIVFIIYESKNQIKEYIHFLTNKVAGLIGFNNLNYDYPMLHYILTSLRQYEGYDANFINGLLFQKSQQILQAQWSAIPHWETLIPQLDLFRIHHFDNKFKSTSLKEVQFVIRWNNVEDLDKSFMEAVDESEIHKILSYNRNDVLSTEAFYYETLDDINFRRDAKKIFGFGDEVLNYNDGKIGGEVLLRSIAREMGIQLRDLKKMRTTRSTIALKDCLVPYIWFKTPKFDSVLSKAKETIVTDTGEFKKTITFMGVKFVFGSGGLHACNRSGVYEIDNNYKILDIDVASFYSKVGISNKFSPEHLGHYFYNVYERSYNHRIALKKLAKTDKGKKSEVSTWKLGLNKPFGDSKSKYSPFYDPMYTLKITLNGQMVLAMLTERILLLGDIELIQVNTDGLTVKYPKEKLDEIMNICKLWEKKTDLMLEYQDYKQITIRDVNNYIAVVDKPEEEIEPQFPKSTWYDNWYTIHKSKGVFQVVPETNGKIAYNKDWSQRIVPKALYKYFIYGTPVKETILECTDIRDFTKRFRATAEWHTEYTDTDAKQHKLTKTTRYYMSSNGGKLYKKNKDGRKQLVEAKGRVTLLNKLPVDIETKNILDYKVDYSYYIKQCNDVIHVIENYGQQNLFG